MMNHDLKRIQCIDKLYHGTDQLFDEFDLSKAKPFKDFGKGIYFTSDFNQAQKWAQKKGDRKSTAYIYCYAVDNHKVNDFKILELLQYDREWLEFICKSRIEGKETDYDIIYDRIADNQYSEISDSLQKYAQNGISAEEVIEKIRWDNPKADQYCFKNRNALSILGEKELIVQHKDLDGRWLQERC